MQRNVQRDAGTSRGSTVPLAGRNAHAINARASEFAGKSADTGAGAGVAASTALVWSVEKLSGAHPGALRHTALALVAPLAAAMQTPHPTMMAPARRKQARTVCPSTHLSTTASCLPTRHAHVRAHSQQSPSLFVTRRVRQGPQEFLSPLLPTPCAAFSRFQPTTITVLLPRGACARLACAACSSGRT